MPASTLLDMHVPPAVSMGKTLVCMSNRVHVPAAHTWNDKEWQAEDS